MITRSLRIGCGVGDDRVGRELSTGTNGEIKGDDTSNRGSVLGIRVSVLSAEHFLYIV